MLNFSMRGHDLEGDNLTELAKKCKTYGIYGMQLALAKSLKDFKQGRFSPALAERLKEELDGVKIPVLGSYINPSATNKEILEGELSKFCEQLKYARFLGAHMVGTETGSVGDKHVPENNHTEEAYEYFLSNMSYLVENAEKLGVMIGIEGVWSFVVNTPEKMRRALDDLNSPNVLAIFDPVNYLNEKNSNIIIKGLRAVSDFEYEFQMALMNRKLNPNVETLFMMTSGKYSYLSSSIVKEVARHKASLEGLVPDFMIEEITELIEKKS